MRITQIGKRKYAFGLEWAASAGVDHKETIAERLGEGTRAYYTLMRAPDGDAMVGFGPPEEGAKGRVYSYATAIASRKVDGIYVGPTAPGEIWYVVVNDGQVVPSTDRLMPEADALEAIGILARTFDVPLFLAEGMDGSRFGEHTTFDSELIAAKAKIRPMKALGGESSPIVGVIVLLVVLGGIGFVAWWTFLKPQHADSDPAAQARLLRDTYLNAVRSAAQMPASNQWIVDARRLSQSVLPPSVGGWGLEGVSCSPRACSGTYALASDTHGFGITPAYARFGADRVLVSKDQRSFAVSVPLQPTAKAWTDDELLHPTKTSVPYLDAVGRFGMYFAGAEVDGDVAVELLHTANAAPPEASALIKETLATRADQYLDRSTLKSHAVFMDSVGFTATTLNFSLGHGSIPPAWRMEWTRLHGGEGQ